MWLGQFLETTITELVLRLPLLFFFRLFDVQNDKRESIPNWRLLEKIQYV